MARGEMVVLKEIGDGIMADPIEVIRQVRACEVGDGADQKFNVLKFGNHGRILPCGFLKRKSCLYELKGKLSSIVVLVMALKFLEHLVEWKEASDTLLYAIAITTVSGTLIALSYLGNKDQP